MKKNNLKDKSKKELMLLQDEYYKKYRSHFQKAALGMVKKVEVSLLPLIYQNIYGIIIAVKWSDCGLRWFYRCLSFGRSFRGALR